MNLVISNSTNPFFNLAAEEFLLKNSDKDFFMLWQNEPTLVVGCYQNTAAEVDVQKAQQLNVHIVRRITGGGAVYHDLGNLNFSLIKNGGGDGIDAKEVYAELTRPVLAALAQMGVTAELGGRNDILVDGKKISGCALHSSGNRTLLHGAILFDANLKILSQLLTPHSKKFEGKAIQSVSSRVANVADFLQNKILVDDFKDLIISNLQNFNLRPFSPAELAEIEKLKQEKYLTDEWNFTKVMAHSFAKHEKTSAGNVEVKIDFANNAINNIQFFGDFFSEKDVQHLEQLLHGCPYTPDAIRKKLSNENISQYIRGLSTEDFLSLIF